MPSARVFVPMGGPHVMCEDCGKKRPSWGDPNWKNMPKETRGRKVRWCPECARSNHPGSINTNAGAMCEDCKVKRATWGEPGWSKGCGSKKQRWCATCAKSNHSTAESPSRRTGES